MAKKSLWKYYIGIITDKGIKYVTSIDAGKVARWEDGKEAKEFTLTTATDICMGLNLNFHSSVVIKSPTYINLGN